MTKAIADFFTGLILLFSILGYMVIVLIGFGLYTEGNLIPTFWIMLGGAIAWTFAIGFINLLCAMYETQKEMLEALQKNSNKVLTSSNERVMPVMTNKGDQ